MGAGLLAHVGFYPADGYLFPKGMQNAIPEPLRPYIPTYTNSFAPMFLAFYDCADNTLYPLGMKAFPDHLLTTDKRKMYRAIVDSDMEEIERLVKEGFDMSQIIIPDHGYTALGMFYSNKRDGMCFEPD